MIDSDEGSWGANGKYPPGHANLDVALEEVWQVLEGQMKGRGKELIKEAALRTIYWLSQLFDEEGYGRYEAATEQGREKEKPVRMRWLTLLADTEGKIKEEWRAWLEAEKENED